MRATVIRGAGDVRVEEVPDPTLHEPTDADVFPTGHHCAVTAGVNPRTTVTVIGDGAVGPSAVPAANREALKVLVRKPPIIWVVRVGDSLSADHGLDDDINDDIDDAYRTKYRGSPSAVRHITSAQARLTTIELAASTDFPPGE